LTSAVLLFSYSLKINLEFLSGKKLKASESMGIYLKANLCKYLPGNVMQYVTRNLYASKIGISQTKMVFGSFLEIFFVTVTSLVLSLALSRELFLNLVQEYVPVTLYAIIVCAFLVAICVSFFLFKKSKRVNKLFNQVILQFKEVNLIQFCKLAGKMFLIVAYNHILLGIMLFLLLRQVSSVTDVSVLTVISAYIVAWLVGFITPGAPGGIGVKEVILSILLMDSFGREYVLVCALLFRLVTVLADVFSFLFFMVYIKVKGNLVKR